MSLQVFEADRLYDDADDELNLIAPKAKRAQWRHRRVGPPFLKFGRRVKYHGADLNSWINGNRIATASPEIQQLG
ncbi:MerR family transcriptional regulator [Leisingera sp. M527]|uniref:MerR family transcriptional regulator n=1 Tax=Leisingera sp. M527 TaxID=2867014 RepID=UPI0021A94581|nr:MerR family transcriptional regulator [Leisingera sp. M527]UWQ32081.1 MerR family transcriptional regulator [Leisingera sp. M527]